jgi:hypothetical protein
MLSGAANPKRAKGHLMEVVGVVMVSTLNSPRNYDLFSRVNMHNIFIADLVLYRTDV